MRIRSTLEIAALCALAVAARAHAGGPASSSPAVGTAQPTAAAAAIEFRDATGKPITSGQFNDGVKKGQHYIAKKDMQAGRIVLSLLPPGVNAPGSMSLADVKTSSFAVLSIKGVHYKVVFHDVHGKTIDQATFAAGAPQHQRYTTQLDKQKGAAILTLLPIGVNKPDSKTTSDWIPESPMSLASIPKPGTRFPPLNLPKVGGGGIDSASRQGKPYVVDFFFADCIGCIAELPVLNAWHKEHPERPAIAVTFDDAETAAGFVKQRHFDWPVGYAGKAFTDKLGIKVYPTMVVVGADGRVLATRVGANDTLSPDKLEQWVVASIKGARGVPEVR